jgi:F1F0 ATPase subunit 2
MTMIDPLGGFLAWAAGVVLGAIFFGGLWWTIRKSLASQRIALWFAGSFLLRFAIILSGFYLVADGDWRRLLLSLLGFMMARLTISRLFRPANPTQTRSAVESGHAP